MFLAKLLPKWSDSICWYGFLFCFLYITLSSYLTKQHTSAESRNIFMANYIVNRNQDFKGYNEVHITSCGHLPETQNQVQLGWFSDAKGAVSHAQAMGYPNADGCYYCCIEAHKG